MAKKTAKKKPPVKRIVRLKPLVEANIAETGYSSYFKLKIYKTAKDIAKATAHINSKKLGLDDGSFAGVVIEQNEVREELDKASGDIVCQFATCFLSAEDLSYSIIAHECLHLGLSNERLLKRYVGGYKDEDARYGNVPEERLAYCIESYVAAIIASCIKYKISIKNE